MKVNLKLLAFQVVILPLLVALVLFLTAGTIAWAAGWVFLILFFGPLISLPMWLLRYNPDLLAERMTGVGKPDQKNWDKVLYLVMVSLFLGWIILMPLDAVRFHWSTMPALLQGAGAIILLLSFYLMFLTFRENPYLSTAVRIQSERGQTVITTGPYRYVRHPLYAGGIVLLIGSALLLGSWYGLLMGLVIAATMVIRAVLEERTLLEELPGYEAYMAHVKYRLVPYIW